MQHFNGLSPAEAERLAILIEELAEAQQVACKILRHGYESYHPARPEETNRMLLETEIGHVQHAMKLMCSEGDVTKEQIHTQAKRKAANIGQYLHHQKIPLPTTREERFAEAGKKYEGRKQGEPHDWFENGRDGGRW